MKTTYINPDDSLKTALFLMIYSNSKNASVSESSTNINWKFIDGDFIGKRSVYTYDNRSCWLEDTNIENVKNYCKDTDYQEVFRIAK